MAKPDSGRSKEEIAADIKRSLVGERGSRYMQDNMSFAKNVSTNISSIVENLTVENEVMFSPEQEKIFKDMLKILGKISVSSKDTSRERKTLEEMYAKLIVQTDKEIEKLETERKVLSEEISKTDEEITREKEEVTYAREEILQKSIEIETLLEEKKITQDEAKRLREQVDEQIARTDLREEELKRKQIEIEQLRQRGKEVETTIGAQQQSRQEIYDKFPQAPKKRESTLDFLLGTVGIKEKAMGIVKGFLPGFGVDEKVGGMIDKFDEKVLGTKFGKYLEPYLSLSNPEERTRPSKDQLIEAQRQKVDIESTLERTAPKAVGARELGRKRRRSSRTAKEESIFIDDPLGVYGGTPAGPGGLRTIDVSPESSDENLDVPSYVGNNRTPDESGVYEGRVKTRTPKEMLSSLERTGAVTKKDDVKGELVVHTKLLTDIRDLLKQQNTLQAEKDRETDLDQGTVSNEEIQGNAIPKEEERLSDAASKYKDSENRDGGSGPRGGASVGGGAGGGEGGGIGIGDMLEYMAFDRLASKGGRALGTILGKGRRGLGRMLGRGRGILSKMPGIKGVLGMGRRLFSGGLGKRAGSLGARMMSTMSRIAPKTAGKLAGKTAMKAGGKMLGKSLLKKIPIVGAIAGLGFGISRLLKGDVLGAMGEVASGVVGTVPGLGTAASVAIDAGLAAKDSMSSDGSSSGEASTEDSGAEGTTPVRGSAKSKEGSGLGLLGGLAGAAGIAGLAKMAGSGIGRLGSLAAKANPIGMMMSAGKGLGGLVKGMAIPSFKKGGGLMSAAVSGLKGAGKLAMRAGPLGLALAAGGGITALISSLLDKGKEEPKDIANMTPPTSSPSMNIANNSGGSASGNTPVRIQDNSFIRYQDKRVARV